MEPRVKRAQDRQAEREEGRERGESLKHIWTKASSIVTT